MSDGGVEREMLHHRAIDLRGYRRADGLWDIEASLIDRKSYDFTRSGGQVWPAGTKLHDMTLRLTIDDGMVIRDATATMPVTPWLLCTEAADGLKALHGLRIGPNWLSEARRRLERDHRCTHLTELLGPLATVAMQTQSVIRDRNKRAADGRPSRIDSCYAYAAGRTVAARLWPEHYTGPDNSVDKAAD
jgi:hypothetical protein